MLFLSTTVLCFYVCACNSFVHHAAPCRIASSSLKMAFPNLFGPTIPKITTKKKLCVITGTTSGLGKETAKALMETGEYFVICACRDVEKMEEVAEQEGFDANSYTVFDLDLSSFASVKKFVAKLKSSKSRPLDRLVCNAAVYQPALMTVGCHLRY